MGGEGEMYIDMGRKRTVVNKMHGIFLARKMQH